MTQTIPILAFVWGEQSSGASMAPSAAVLPRGAAVPAIAAFIAASHPADRAKPRKEASR